MFLLKEAFEYKQRLDVFLNKKKFKYLKQKILQKIPTEQVVHYLVQLLHSIRCGKSLKKSCELGIKYVNHAIKTRPKLGKGNGPINHLN